MCCCLNINLTFILHLLFNESPAEFIKTPDILKEKVKDLKTNSATWVNTTTNQKFQKNLFANQSDGIGAVGAKIVKFSLGTEAEKCSHCIVNLSVC